MVVLLLAVQLTEKKSKQTAHADSNNFRFIIIKMEKQVVY